jgi:hypothetical protein
MSLCNTHKENWRNNKTQTKKIWNFCVLESLPKTIKFLACLKARKPLMEQNIQHNMQESCATKKWNEYQSIDKKLSF